ncbi:MAG: potassium-transporting ATPase subunit F [Parachlamydiaceae bacterium]|nr:potassium-transporting ATPase subunit F [Parachlamydiaceae bacterium]
MQNEFFLTGAVALFIFFYLVYSVIYPEKF